MINLSPLSPDKRGDGAICRHRGEESSECANETQHALDGQNFELEDTIDRELELFRSAHVSLEQASLIAERLHTGSRVVDISFDGAPNPPVYRVKNIQKNQIWENSIDARTGSSSAGGKHALYVKDLEAQDRRNLWR